MRVNLRNGWIQVLSTRLVWRKFWPLWIVPVIEMKKK
jgi:hypothetical protein